MAVAKKWTMKGRKGSTDFHFSAVGSSGAWSYGPGVVGRAKALLGTASTELRPRASELRTEGTVLAVRAACRLLSRWTMCCGCETFVC